MNSNSVEKLNNVLTAFWQFADAVRNSGNSLGDSFLMAFTTLLAFRSSKVDVVTNDIELVFKALNDFKELILVNYGNDLAVDLTFNLYNHPALFRLLYICNNQKLSDEELSQLLDWIVSNSSLGFGESLTPKGVADLMVKIADVKVGERVYDPAMGVAGFLRALHRSGLAQTIFTGIEVNQKIFYIASLYQYLLRDKYSNLIRRSAFSFNDEFTEKKFDVVLCNPPVKRVPLSEAIGRYSEILPKTFISSEMSVNFIDLALSKLNEGGRAVFLINMKPLFADAELTKIRQYWVESGLLKKVISLPSKLLEHTDLKCAILVFSKDSVSKSSDEPKIVKFVKADDCYIEEKRNKRLIDESNIENILKRVTHINDSNVAKQVTCNEIAENNYSLVPDQYLSQRIGRVNLNLSKLWKPLDEIGEIIRGGSFSKLKKGNEPIIQGRDLRVTRLKIEELECKDFSSYEKPIVRTQLFDVLVQRIGTNPAAYFVTSEEGLAVSDTVYIIRFTNLEPDLIDFISQFLNSEEGSKRIGELTHLSVIPTLSKKVLNKIEVPVPDGDVVNLVKEMNQVEAGLRLEYENAAQLRKSLFGGFDEVDLSFNFNKVRLTTLVLKNALLQKDDINYKVSNLYPFPLAFPYRNIYIEREHAAIYDRQMKYGEHLLSFLASVGISLVFGYRDKINVPLDDLISEIFSGLQKGISPGHWRNLLHKTCMILRDVEDESLAADFSSIWFKGRGKKSSDFASMTESHIVKKLNDFKHSRGPVNLHEYKEAGELQKEAIRKLLEELDFLSQCQIVIIDDIDTEWATEQVVYKASLLQGDHPAFEKDVFSADKSLSKDKIYLRYEDRFISLYPFLSFIYNSETKRSEIFSFDKQDKQNKRLALKSFDSGTSIYSREVLSDLNSLANTVTNRE